MSGACPRHQRDASTVSVFIKMGRSRACTPFRVVPSDSWLFPAPVSDPGWCLPALPISIDKKPAAKRRIAIHDRHHSEDTRIPVRRGSTRDNIAIDDDGILRSGGGEKE